MPIAILFVLHIIPQLLEQTYVGAVARDGTAKFELMCATEDCYEHKPSV